MKTGEMYTYALVNPNAKFYRTNLNNAVYKFLNGHLVYSDNDKFSCEVTKLDEDWELVREEVNFMTAVNSGKRIRPVDHTIDGFLRFTEWDLSLKMINGLWLVE